MAKKKPGQLDDFSMDDFNDLEFGSDDFGNGPSGGKEDRKPVTRAAKALAGGALDHIKDPRAQIKFIKDALPPGYDTAYETIDATASGLGELYDTAAKEAKAVTQDMKGAVRAILPEKPGFLPEKIHKKLKEWSKAEEVYKRMSNEEMESRSIASDLGQIFQLQAEDQAQRDRSDEAKSQVRDLVNSKLQLNSLNQLDAIRQGIGRLTNYQDQVTHKYQQKSLELQYRQYYVQKRLLTAFEAHSKISGEHLKDIRKNTGLPDFVKMHNKEVIEQLLKQSLFGKISGSINGWTGGIGKRVINHFNSKVKNFAQDLSGNISQITGVAEMGRSGAEMAGDMGMSGQDAAIDAGGGLLGNFGMGKLLGKITKPLAGYLAKNKKVVNFGRKINNMKRTIGTQANEWSKGGQSSGNQLIDMLLGEVREGMGTFTKERGVRKSAAGKLDEAVHFNLHARLALTEIIPGWLARIHNELRITRTGDESLRPLNYSMTSGKFDDAKSTTARIKDAVLNSRTKNNVNANLDKVMEAMKADQLSRPAQEALRKAVLKAAEAGEGFSVNTFMKDGSLGRDVDHKTSREIKSHLQGVAGIKESYAEDGFTKLYKDDLEGDGQENLGNILNAFDSTVNSIPDLQRILIEETANGNQENLEELGLITHNGSQWVVNQKAFLDYIGEPEKVNKLRDRLKQAKSKRKPRRGGGAGGAGGPSPTPGGSLLSAARVIRNKVGSLRNLGSDLIGDLTNNPASPEVEGPPPPSMADAARQALRDARDRAKSMLESLSKSIRSELEPLVDKAKTLYADHSPAALDKARSLIDEATATANKLRDRIDREHLQGEAKRKLEEAAKAAEDVAAKARKYIEVRMKAAAAPGAGAGGASGGPAAQPTPTVDVGNNAGAPVPLSTEPSATEALIEATTEAAAVQQEISGSMAEAVFGIAQSVEAILNILASQEGGGGGGGPGPKLQGMDRLYVGIGRGIGKVGKLGGKIIGGGLKKVYNAGKFIRGKIPAMAKGVFKLGKGALNFGSGMVGAATARFKDIYVKGEEHPRIQAVNMRQGKYTDKQSGKVIKSMRDITGPVMNEEGDEVISAADFEKGLVDKFGKPLPVMAFNALMSGANLLIAPHRFVFNTLKKGIPALLKLVKAKDVYVTGEDKPRLLARVMREGGYTRKKDGKAVHGIADITSDVVDDTGNVLLTTEDIHKGLVDVNGKPLRTIGAKIGSALGAVAGFGLKAGKWLLKKAMGGVDMLKQFFGGGWEVVKNMFSGFSLLGYSKPVVDRLDKIYAILEERLPGGKPKASGDTDGDGDRNGSREDQLQARAEAEADAEKAKSGSMWDKMKGFFSRKEKKEGDGGGGLMGLLGGGLGGIKKILGALTGGLGGLTKAIFGLIPGFGLITKALGVIGKATIFSAKVGLKGAQLAGKGAWAVAKGAGSLLARGGMALAGTTMGASALATAGSIAGAIGTGALAILTSPVTLAVGAAALVAYVGYKAYKYATRPRNWVTQYRMAQYGFKTKDEEKVGKIAALEQMLIKVVQVSKGKEAKLGTGVKVSEMIKIFGIDHTKEEELQNFLSWFQYRFKPVYLSHLTVLCDLTGKTDLAGVDDNLYTKEKIALIKRTHFPLDDRSPYAVGLSPFPADKGKVDLDMGQVNSKYEDTLEIVEDDGSKHDEEVTARKVEAAKSPAQKAAEQKKQMEDEQKSYWSKSKQAVASIIQSRIDRYKKLGKNAMDLYGKAVDGTSSLIEGGVNAFNATKDFLTTAGNEASKGYAQGGVAGAAGAAGTMVYKTLKGDAQKNRDAMVREMLAQGITDPVSQAQIMANVDNETGGFTRIDENLNYKADRMMAMFKTAQKKGRAATEAAAAGGPRAIANFLYGGRMGNDENDDGWKYRGRGFIQLTGKGNYAAAGKYLGLDLVNNPDLVFDPEVAAKTTMYFMTQRVGKKLLATGDTKAIRKVLNGGTIGLEHVAKGVEKWLPLAYAGKIVPSTTAPASTGATGTPAVPPLKVVGEKAPAVPSGASQQAAGNKPMATPPPAPLPKPPAAKPAAGTPPLMLTPPGAKPAAAAPVKSAGGVTIPAVTAASLPVTPAAAKPAAAAPAAAKPAAAAPAAAKPVVTAPAPVYTTAPVVATAKAATTQASIANASAQNATSMSNTKNLADTASLLQQQLTVQTAMRAHLGELVTLMVDVRSNTANLKSLATGSAAPAALKPVSSKVTNTTGTKAPVGMGNI